MEEYAQAMQDGDDYNENEDGTFVSITNIDHSNRKLGILKNSGVSLTISPITFEKTETKTEEKM